MPISILRVDEDITSKAPINVFTDAVPSIPAGTEIYIQNLGNTTVRIGEDNSLVNTLQLTPRATSHSSVTVKAGSDAWVHTLSADATLAISY